MMGCLRWMDRVSDRNSRRERDVRAGCHRDAGGEMTGAALQTKKLIRKQNKKVDVRELSTNCNDVHYTTYTEGSVPDQRPQSA